MTGKRHSSAQLQPLTGRRILVTRAAHQAGELTQRLQKLGAAVMELPVIEVVPPASLAPLDHELAAIAGYNWLVVTSTNAVRVLVSRIRHLNLPRSHFASLRIAAVGPATARALEEEGLTVHVIPSQHEAEYLAHVLCPQVNGARVLLLTPEEGRNILGPALEACGATVRAIVAYRTRWARPHPDQVRLALFPIPDAVIFTSPSTARSFVALAVECAFDIAESEVLALSIGPVTTEALEELDWNHILEVKPSSMDGIVSAAVAVLGTS